MTNTHDEQGNMLTYKYRDGFWHEYTRDDAGWVLTCKRSDGYWYEFTRDAQSRVLAFKDGFVSCAQPTRNPA